MPTLIDLAKRLKGQGAAQGRASGGASGVRYGTVQAAAAALAAEDGAGDGAAAGVTVLLDGSTEPVTLRTDAPVSEGERVRVVSQGGSYAVVALAGVAQAASDAQDSADAAAERAEEVADELSYAMRVTSEGLEVGLRKDGAYTGARVVLSPSGLVFKPESGLFDLASFTADAVTLGSAFDQNVRVTKDGFFITDQGFDTRFYINTSDTDASVQSQKPLSIAYMDGYSTVAFLSFRKKTCADGTQGGEVTVSAYGDEFGEATHLTLDSSGLVELRSPDGELLGMSPDSGVSCSLKAAPEPCQTLVQSCVTAWRHMGWVVVLLDNYAPWTSAVTTPTSKEVGTLPEGWRPPERVKGPLYPGSANYSAMAYVDTGGKVSVYSNALGASQQLSGYVVYPATQ